MEIVLKIPFQKYMSVGAFVSCMAKALYSIFVLINKGEAETLSDTILMIRDFLDIVVWFVIAILFLHIFLYGQNRVTRRNLASAIDITIVFAILKVACSIFCTMYFVNSGIWNIVYSVLESLVLLWALIYMLKFWYSKQKDSRKLRQHDKPQDGYTLRDELERRFSR